MGYYGGTGSQVYLGWKDKYNFHIQWPNGTITPDPSVPGIQVGSPQYEWKMNANKDFGCIAELYWYYMCSGKSSIDVLDLASQGTYGVYFSSSYLKRLAGSVGK